MHTADCGDNYRERQLINAREHVRAGQTNVSRYIRRDSQQQLSNSAVC